MENMLEQLIAEATECDFKVAVEKKKPKSWLKSVSAFSNNELILKGTNRSFDTLVTDAVKKDYSFTLLEATYRERTGLHFEPEDYFSFGLTDKHGFLTNAGRLMTDQHIVYNSRMFCTRWNGLEKGSIFDDALDDKEYEGNRIYLLNSGCEFIRNNSKVRFSKKHVTA